MQPDLTILHSLLEKMGMPESERADFAKLLYSIAEGILDRELKVHPVHLAMKENSRAKTFNERAAMGPLRSPKKLVTRRPERKGEDAGEGMELTP